jgi:hypothetical protein
MRNQLASLTNTTQVAPAAVTATSGATATGVDVSTYEGPLMFVQVVGAVSGTTPTLNGKIQDSANNSNWADVSGATFTEVTESTNMQTVIVDKRAVRQYVRYIGTVAAGANPSFTMAVVLSGAKKVI